MIKIKKENKNKCCDFCGETKGVKTLNNDKDKSVETTICNGCVDKIKNFREPINKHITIKDNVDKEWWYSQMSGSTFEVKNCSMKGDLVDMHGVHRHEPTDFLIVTSSKFYRNAILKEHTREATEEEIEEMSNKTLQL